MPSEPSNRCCPTDLGVATCVYTPTGNDFYIAGSPTSKSGVVLISDIFGMVPNSKRLADLLAGEGYLVVMPDFFGQRAWSHKNWPPNFDSAEWKNFHAFVSKFDSFLPKAEKAVEMLRQMGCTKVGAVGMCWGATLPFKLSSMKLIDSCAVAHPSFFNADTLRLGTTPACILPSKDDANLDDVEAEMVNYPHEPKVYRRFTSIPHGFFGSRFDPEKFTLEEMKEVMEARTILYDFFAKTLH